MSTGSSFLWGGAPAALSWGVQRARRGIRQGGQWGRKTDGPGSTPIPRQHLPCPALWLWVGGVPGGTIARPGGLGMWALWVGRALSLMPGRLQAFAG